VVRKASLLGNATAEMGWVKNLEVSIADRAAGARKFRKIPKFLLVLGRTRITRYSWIRADPSARKKTVQGHHPEINRAFAARLRLGLRPLFRCSTR